jgi:hypothetical protein
LPLRSFSAKLPRCLALAILASLPSKREGLGRPS